MPKSFHGALEHEQHGMLGVKRSSIFLRSHHLPTKSTLKQTQNFNHDFISQLGIKLDNFFFFYNFPSHTSSVSFPNEDPLTEHSLKT